MVARVMTSLTAFYRLLGAASASGRLFERDCVLAAINPRIPDRSFFNAVVYREAAALAAALDELADVYARAGVRAWTVWVPDGDRQAVAALTDAGHVLDARPRAMLLELRDFSAPPADPVRWQQPVGTEAVASLNARAYGFPAGEFDGAFEGLAGNQLRRYVALDGDTPVCCACALDAGDDCHLVLVATAPEAQGRGLASALVAQLLVDARERGCRTSSLTATKAGYGVYRRLGYRDVAAIEMWERRAPPA
jgi:ribosomal protein S18 acetylase RimI-like enzyme